MSLLTVPNQWGFEFHNWGGANAYPTSNVLGDALTLKEDADLANATWVECASAAEIAFDVYELRFGILHPNNSGADRSGIFDVGLDEGGGTFSAIISNIISGASAASTQFYFPWYVVPCRIKAGTRIGIRAATVNTVTDAGYAFIHALGQPSRPELLPPSSTKFETLGYTSGAVGTAVSCQANPNGRTYSSTWTSIGTTTFRWSSIFAAMSCKTASVSTATYFAEIGFGSSTTDVTKLMTVSMYAASSESVYYTPPPGVMSCAIPSGSGIYARLLGDLVNPANQGNVHFTVHGGG